MITRLRIHRADYRIIRTVRSAHTVGVFLFALGGQVVSAQDQLTFNGVDDIVTVQNTALNAIGYGDFTVEAWVRGEEALQVQHPRILSNVDQGWGNFLFFFHGLWGGSNYKMLGIAIDGANYILINNGTLNGSLLDGECHHVAIARENDSLHFYADGALLGHREIFTANPTVASGLPELTIGNEEGSSGFGFEGDISQVRIWNYARTQAEIQGSMNASIPGNTPGLASYWELDEGAGQDVLDKVTMVNGVLGVNGSTEPMDPTWTSGSCLSEPLDPAACLLFDGADDHITASNMAPNAIGYDDFTVEAWVQGDEAAQVQHPYMLSNTPGFNAGFLFFFHGLWGGSQYKMLSVRFDGANYILINNGNLNGSLLDGECHHVAVTRTNDSLHFYADGMHLGDREIFTSNPTIASASNDLWIGGDDTPGNGFNGKISHLRLWHRALTQAEIQNQMNQTVPGNSPDLLAYWPLEDGSGQNITDLTMNAPGLLGDDPSTEVNDPVWTLDCCASEPIASDTCLLFDGVDDHITASNMAPNTIGYDDFTVEAWVEGNEALQVQHPYMLSNAPGFGPGFLFFFHGLWGGSNYKMLAVRFDGVNYILIDNGNLNGSLLDGECHHVAVTRTNDSLHFYADGMHLGDREIFTSNPTIASASNDLWIGGDDTPGNGFNGKISDLRLWHRALTQTEIQNQMNQTVPGNSPDLLAYWPMGEGSGQNIADLTNNAPGLLGDDATVEVNDPSWAQDCCTSEPIGSGECLLFDGANDHITASNMAPNTIGYDDFTVEAWVQGDEAAQVQHPYMLSNTPGFNAGFLFFFHGLWGGSQYKMLSVRFDGANYILINNGNLNGSLLDGECHHVAVTRTNDSLHFYADGMHLGDREIFTSNPTIASASNDLWIGGDDTPGNGFNGKISHLRLWHRALTQTEIQNQMNQTVPGNSPDLLAYWPLEDGSGQNIADLTMNAPGVLGDDPTSEANDPIWAQDCCVINPIITTIVDPPSGHLGVYPNPASTELWLTLPEGTQRVTVNNMAGETVLVLASGSRGTARFDVSDLASGIYLVTVQSASMNVSQRFIKMD